MKPKHQNKTTENNFQCLIWMFWVCQLPRAWSNIDYSQLMSLFDLYQLQHVYWSWSIIQQEISSINSANHLKKIMNHFFLFFFLRFIYLFYFVFWLWWVFVAARGLPLVVGMWGYSLRWWTTHFGGCSGGWAQAYGIQWLPYTCSVVAAQGLICSVVCGIFQDQGWNW